MKIIHSGRYTASYHAGVLVVEGKQGGRYMTGEQADHWAEAIKTAIDKTEANALCKAILDSD